MIERRIGTPISRGISGGQKRRVTLGTSLVSGRKLLFLDEPTSGLDSTSSREVIAALQRLARQEGVAVIASIHQPSFETLSLFDQLLVLARGKTVFYGPVDQLTWYVAELGHPVQGASASCMWHTSSTARTAHHNPADIMLDLASFDFASSSSTDHKLTLDDLVARWKTKHASQQTSGTLSHHDHSVKARKTGLGYRIRALLHSTLILSHRNIVNYSRNLLAYGIRFGALVSAFLVRNVTECTGMFIGMGLMLGLIVRLSYHARRMR